MKNLGKWQVVSLISRVLAMFLGILQSVIIVRVLSVSEFGIVGVVTAIGALFGIAQHLGLASGTTREISASGKSSDIFKIFLSSIVIKYIVSFPIAISLFIMAPYLAEGVYKHSEITLPLRIYAVVLLIQGVQSIFNSVIAGLQRFHRLFVYQVVIAIISILVYTPLVFFYKVNGYFYALTLFNVIATISLAFLALWPIRNELKMPTKAEFGIIFKNIVVLSLGIYFVKMIYTVWYKLGQVALPRIETLESVGIFSLALLYASKLQTISDALTDVNLPVFSREFSLNFENFKISFVKNFSKLYLVILYLGMSASFFSKEIIIFAVGDKYDQALIMVLPLVLSFAFYSFINLLKSSVLIPARMVKEMILGYVFMLALTGISYFILIYHLDSLQSMSIGMFVGSLAGFLLICGLILAKLKLPVLPSSTLYISLFLLCLGGAQLFDLDFFQKVVIYLVYSFIAAYFVDRNRVLTFSELSAAIGRINLEKKQ